MSAVAAVLIADDDSLLRTVLGRAVRRLGHRVVEVADGAAIVDRAAETSFDLCIMDAQMPGPDLSERIRALRRTGDPRIVVVSGAGTVPPAAELPGVSFIGKPFDLAVLHSLVGRGDEEAAA